MSRIRLQNVVPLGGACRERDSRGRSAREERSSARAGGPELDPGPNYFFSRTFPGTKRSPIPHLRRRQNWERVRSVTFCSAFSIRVSVGRLTPKTRAISS